MNTHPCIRVWCCRRGLNSRPYPCKVRSTTELRQPILYSLTKGYCVKTLTIFNTSIHLKNTGVVKDFEPHTRSGVTSHTHDTPDSTNQRLHVTDSESSVLERCVKKDNDKTKHEIRPPFTSDEIRSMQEMIEGG